MRIAWEKFAPARRRGVEYLDDPDFPPHERARALADVGRSNALFGGWSSVWGAIAPFIGQMPRQMTLLDVGTGHGEMAVRVARELGALGISVTTLGVDVAPSVASAAARTLDGALAGDALRLPLRSACADLVICSQMLHHFTEPDVQAILGELNRVSRRFVVISDLQRSRLAAAGFWLASIALGFHPVTRHDGVVSVMRGFTIDELYKHLHSAIGAHRGGRIRASAFWRLSAAWRVAAR